MAKCSIFVFSGTGNTAYVASRIQYQMEEKKIETHLYNIDEIFEMPDISDSDYIGIGYPVYAFGMPSNVLEFVKKEIPKAEKDQKAFVFASYGGKGLYAIQECVDILNSRGYKILRSRGFVMPDNYLISIISTLGKNYTQEEKKKLFMDIKVLVENYAIEVLDEREDVEAHGGIVGKVFSGLLSSLFRKYGAPKTAKKFYIDSHCNSCGLCAKICPSANINMVEGKPEFLERCISCTRCYNYCPQKAIRHDGAPNKEARYRAPGYKPPEVNKIT